MIVKLANLTAIRQDSIDNSLSSNDIKSIFNEFLIRFEQLETSDTLTRNLFYNGMKEITDAILLIAPNKLLNSRLLHHPLIHVLHQLLISLLDKWCLSSLDINILEMNIFFKIILIFVRIAEQLPSENTDHDRNKLEDLQAMKKFLFQVRQQIDGIILHKQYFNDDQNIYTLGLLTIKILQDSPYCYHLGICERLIDDLVVNSLDSYDFIQAMRQLENGKPLPHIEHYLLLTCWEYLSSRSTIKQKPSSEMTTIELIHCIADALLIQLMHTLDEPPIIAPHILSYILERCQKLLNVPNLPTCDHHGNYIINYLSKILQASSSTNRNHLMNISIALHTFEKLVNNQHIRSLIRKTQLNSLFNRYASSDKPEQTRQLALAILTQTMDEDEINKNSTQITANFLDQLIQLHPNTHNPHLDTTLTSLKMMIQHEQIKNQLVSQGGLDKLIEFIRDSDSNKQSTQQLEDVLKVLWSCTFNNTQALNILQQDLKFIERVNEILEKAQHDGNKTLEKAAEGVVWKVVKEEKFEQEQQEKEKKTFISGIDQPTEDADEQYDCMISYSWSDMNLVDRIFHHMTNKLGYKVWLDREQMHGSTIEAMANAVENAYFILMCMSETYKQSANCQSEAEYAFKRKKHIIPIKMTEDYVADGWLGFILGSRMYIDFGKYDFDKAMTLLNNEIQLQKKKRKEVKSVMKVEEKHETEENQNDSRQIEETINMENILKWNEAAVQDFLRKNDLSDLLPLCQGMHGMELLDLYGMCKSSSVTMYQSLKFELFNNHEKILPIAKFLHFIRRLRVVDGNYLPLNVYIYTEDLAEPSRNDE